MTKRKVRCFTASTTCGGDVVGLWYSLPDFGDTDHLYMCIHCGAVLAVNVDREHYSGIPYSALKKTLTCPNCGKSLTTSVPYPDTFLCPDGTLGHFFRGDNSIPSDSEAVVVDLWDPYSELSLSSE